MSAHTHPPAMPASQKPRHRRAPLASGLLRAGLAAASLAAVAAPAAATPPAVSPARTALMLTLYQTGPALIEDHRQITVSRGETALSFTGISPALLPPSLRLAPVQGQGQGQGQGVTFRVREQAWRPARPLLPELLRAAEGKTITLLRTVDGKEVLEQAKLLRAHPEPVLEINGKIRIGLPGQVLFDALPDGLPLTAGLDVTVDAAAAGSGAAALRYLSGGLTWSADHVIELAEDGKTAHLATHATLTNATGQDWPQAMLALVAGQVETASAPPPMPAPMARGMAMAAAPMMEKAASLPDRETLGAVHLYTLPHPVSLGREETRQVTLLRAETIPTRLTYSVRGAGSQPSDAGQATPQPVPVTLVLDNAAKGGAGQPLPGGLARVYQKDGRGQVRLLGSSPLSDTPVDGSARLPLGAAFDVTAAGRVTRLTRISDRQQETSHEIRLHNARPQPVTVEVIEDLSGDWIITAESAPGQRLDAGSARWTLTVPPRQGLTLTYTARSTY